MNNLKLTMKITDKIDLNKQQLQAVVEIDGPTMVVAGPGTGKTQMLTARIANILLETDTPPEAILALTFTESGVHAMRTRLYEIVGLESYKVQIHTFHSFSSDIIKSNPNKFIISDELETLSDIESVRIFKEILDKNKFEYIKSYNAPYYYLKQIQSNIKNLKREAILPEDFEKILEVESNSEEKSANRNKELLIFYKLYQQKLEETGRYDFEDMINWTVKALETDKDLLLDYQEKYHYILVDEYQDTNNAQNRLLKALSSFWGVDANIFVVGDEDQSIYRFQGASLENILSFRHWYPNSKLITLTDNYRSTQTILNGAKSIIEKNSQRLNNKFADINKNLKSKNTFTELKTKIGSFSNNYAELNFLIEEIKRLIKNGVNPTEIAIIYRNNFDSTDIIHALVKENIQFSTEGGNDVLKDPNIKILLKLLYAVNKIKTADDDIDLFHILNYQFLNIDYVTVLKFVRFASRKRLNLFEALAHKDIEKEVGDITQILNLIKKIERWNQLDHEKTFTETFEIIINESGYLSWILSKPEKVILMNKISTIFNEIKKTNKSDSNLNLAKFLENIELMQKHSIEIKENDLDLGKNGIILTTAHKSKGQEYEYVFIVKAIDKKWGNNVKRELFKLPNSILKFNTDQKKDQNEDERRLFYVALTRAKKQIYITHSDIYYQDGNSREVMPSMFIAELDQAHTEKIDTKEYENNIASFIEKSLISNTENITKTQEKEFLQQVFKNFKLSATSLNLYLQCPYKFKLKEIFKTPQFKNKSLCLGSAIHYALERYGKEIKAGKSPDLQFLINRFNDSLVQEIMQKSDYENTKEKGEKILTYYFNAYKDNFIKPLFTELRIGIGSNPIPFLNEDIRLQGVIDKIEPTTTKGFVKVVDYKSGKTKTVGEIEGTTKNSDGEYKRQLIFYKLLCDLDKSLNFVVKEAEIDFVESASEGKAKKVSFEITKEQVEDLKITIKNVMKDILDLKFGKTTNTTTCKTCEFIDHCWPEGLPSGQIEFEI